MNLSSLKYAGLFVILIVFLIPEDLEAQRWKLRRYEINFGIGGTSFFGDVGHSVADNILGLRDIQITGSRPSVELGLRYKLTGDMALKAGFHFGFLSGFDAGRLEDRNYSFTSTIFEPNIQFEYYLLPEGRSFSSSALFSRRGMVNNYSKIYVYLTGGVGAGFFNPKPKGGLENDARFETATRFGMVFPLGVGMKYSIDSRWSLGLEFTRRFTLTDRIDGLTTEFSNYNDAYYLAQFQGIFKIRTDRRGRPVFNRGYYRRR
jgi:hypothetical protein